jgi:hypothetical protein
MFQFLVFSWALTLGYVPQQCDYVGSQSAEKDGKIATLTDFSLSATAYDTLRITTSVTTYQYAINYFVFAPYRADYKIEANIKVSRMIVVGISHECDHPVASIGNKKTGMFTSEYNYAKMETRAFIRIGNENKGDW